MARVSGRRVAAVTVVIIGAVVATLAGRGAAPVMAGTPLPDASAARTLADLSPGTREGILAAMRAARPAADGPGLELVDLAGRILATVQGSSTVVRGTDGATVRLGDASLGRDGALAPLGAATPEGADTARVRLDRAAGALAVEEWWHNGTTGIEQGFTVRSRPGGAGPLRLSQTVSTALEATIVDGGRGVAFHDGDGERLRFDGLVAYDAMGRHLPASMRLEADRLDFVVDDTGAVFPIVIDPVWSQQAYLKAANIDAGDYFGHAVAVSGDTVVVGAPDEESNATGVDGDGTNNAAGLAGAAYVFVRSGGVWSQQAYLKASNAQVNDRFGYAVAVSGDTIVVGAIQEDSPATGVNGGQGDDLVGAAQSGAAYVFTRSGTTWSQQAYLKASNTDVDDTFGHAVAVSGDTIVVGAPSEDGSDDGSEADSGAAYVFTRVGATWSGPVHLKASDPDLGDRFGSSVAVSGDTIVVGAYFEDGGATGVDGDGTDDSSSGSGAAYVFVPSGGGWQQQAYLKASNTGEGDRFGHAVTVSGDTIAVGAPLEDGAATGVGGDQASDAATNSGAVYVFTRTGTTWSQQSYLKASNTGGGDEFGYAVAVSGDAIVVGAYQEDSGATGVDGDGGDDTSSDSGAAYVFTRSGGTWSQQAYLKASNAGSGDDFGHAVAVSGDTVTVGAWLEGGSSRVVNGADDDAAAFAGAAYVFAVVGQDDSSAVERGPEVTCRPEVLRAGATITCLVSGGDPSIEILWRAAHDPVIAEAGVTLDASGSGTFSFVVPATAVGQELTVELVDWSAPVSLGAVGGPVPSSIPAGEGPVPLGMLLVASAIGGLAVRRRAVPDRAVVREG